MSRQKVFTDPLAWLLTLKMLLFPNLTTLDG